MLLTEGIVLRHHVSIVEINVDPTNLNVIIKLPIPSTKRDIRS